MTIDQELRLSYYREAAEINAEHGVYLVQNVHTRKIYVKKQLTVYNVDIYRYLQAYPVNHVPRIYLAEEDAGGLTVIEEYIPGDTLEEILQQKRMQEEQVLSIISQLCAIIASFHACTPAIINRDIKPSNIKITPDGTVKLIDLNAAKWINEQAPQDTVLLGTQGYAAPEQYGFGPSSILTDIYAVGVLMNVMLTGVFPNQSIAEGPIGEIIRKCVELSPAGRYQSIEELQNALRMLEEKATAAKRKVAWLRLPGFRSNNPIIWLAALTGYALLIYFSVSLEVVNAGPTELIINQICFFSTFFLIILFNGNYLGIQRKFILTRNSHWWIRWMGMLIIDIIILIIVILIMNILMLMPI